MTQHQVPLIGGEGETAVLTEETVSGQCRLACQYRGKTIGSEAGDFFEALCQIRIELEKEHLIPFCYGASLNVYPSGMCRDMASGLAAYKMEMGKRPSFDDLVRIFEQGPDVIPATVSRQREFFKEWLASLG